MVAALKEMANYKLLNKQGYTFEEYSIEAALNSNLFDEVMVSTDDAEIAEIAKQYAANIPFMRSRESSDDFATTIDVLSEVLNQYKILETSFTNACCIYPTASFITPEILKEGYDKLITDKYDSIFPYCVIVSLFNVR